MNRIFFELLNQNYYKFNYTPKTPKRRQPANCQQAKLARQQGMFVNVSRCHLSNEISKMKNFLDTRYLYY